MHLSSLSHRSMMLRLWVILVCVCLLLHQKKMLHRRSHDHSYITLTPRLNPSFAWRPMFWPHSHQVDARPPVPDPRELGSTVILQESISWFYIQNALFWVLVVSDCEYRSLVVYYTTVIFLVSLDNVLVDHGYLVNTEISYLELFRIFQEKIN